MNHFSFPRSGKRWGLGLACLSLLFSARPAQAQLELEKFERQLDLIERETFLKVDADVPLEQRALIDYGAYASFYFLAIDDTTDRTHILRQADLNAYARVNIDGAHQFFVRGRFGYEDFNTGDDFDGDGDEVIGPRLERAVYTFNLARSVAAYEGREVDYNLIFKGGRQLMHWGNGLALSRVVDGGTVIGELGNARVEFIGGQTVRRQLDIDSSRPHFDDDTLRNFYGVMASVDLSGHRPYIYNLIQDDGNKSQAKTFTTRYESVYIGAGVQGPIGDKVLYGLEAVYESGRSQSDALVPPQSEERISAWALDGRLDYLVGDEGNTRITGELVLASGDGDRSLSTTNTVGGNRATTTDTAYNGFGLVNTGLAYAGDASNLFMVRLGASTFPLRQVGPFDKLQLGLDFFILNKLENDGPSTDATDSSSDLGTELDFFANWQVTSDVAFLLRYGVFFPGSAMIANDDPKSFFFGGVTLGF